MNFGQTLEQTVTAAYSLGVIPKGAGAHIKNNLNKKFGLRPYQIEAFERFGYYCTGYPHKAEPAHLLFHMATGSGKTLVMAGLILDLYEKGYRNFVFFVNSTNIIEKTRDNFLNPMSSKYLFNDVISFSGQKVNIKETENFEAANGEDINIVFTTVQGLHRQLNTPGENSLTYEDFEDKKIVLISDEAHHINAGTKKGKSQMKLSLDDASPSWENTVVKILKADPGNWLLEFTATADLDHPAIKAKYQDKLLFDYPLKQFHTDKYSKEVEVLQADLDPFGRALQAVLLSQYRQKVFEKNRLHVKPVILLKSKTIGDSQKFYKEFVAGIGNLTEEQLQKIKASAPNGIMLRVFGYFASNGITLANLLSELKTDFSGDKCIAVDSKNDSEEKQLIVNSLEDRDNGHRAVFAVDKLNEGWDVLNLFDIVRLYDTKDAADSKTTMSEAQLIGRGARYCPFRTSEEQPLYKRKYDDDIGNELRICEELYYHSAHNPKYISELNKALRQIGIKADKTVKKTLAIKGKFKGTNFYNKGAVYVNKRIANDRKNAHELDKAIREKVYEKKFATGGISVGTLMGGTSIKQLGSYAKTHNLGDFPKSIVRKALNKLPFYRFDNLRRYFPGLKSMTEFMGDDKYLNKVKIQFGGARAKIQNPDNEMKLEATVATLEDISKSIAQGYSEYRGTKEFEPKGISKVFVNKDLNISVNEGGDQEYGIGQTETTNKNLGIDLSNEDWYVFNDNYGTSEEKYLVKYIKEAYHDSLKNEYEEVYLIRNERFFKIYSFDEGQPFEPDFVLFLIEKETKEPIVYQVFIEPKGGDRLSNEDSRIKERFLSQIAKEHKLSPKLLYKNREYKLVGIPLYNEAKTKYRFDQEFSNYK